MLLSSKEFTDIQATIECRFTLKRVHDMTRTYSQLNWQSLNLSKKKIEVDLKIKSCGKRLYPTESVKYLGVKIDRNLSWQYHVNDLSIKLNRANTLLSKIRK